MSMDSGKLREAADAAVSSLTDTVAGFRRIDDLWAEYMQASDPAFHEPTESLFGGKQKLTELESHLEICDSILNVGERNASEVVGKDKTNLNALGLARGVAAGRQGVTENRQAIAAIQEQPAKFEVLSRAIDYMIDLAAQQTLRNGEIVARLRLGIEHGQKYIPGI